MQSSEHVLAVNLVAGLEAQITQLKADLEHEVWCHAGCLTLAEGNKDYPPIELQSPAMQAVIKVVQERDNLKAQLDAVLANTAT